MKYNKLLVLLISLMLPPFSASYFHPCEDIECYLLSEEFFTTRRVDNFNQVTRTRNNNIMDVLQRNGFTRMVNLLRFSGLASNLTSNGPFTVFAITNAGLEELQQKAPTWYSTFSTNRNVAAAFFPSYIVNGWVSRNSIRPGSSINTLNGPIYLSSADNGARIAINGTSRIIEDLPASNGIIYVVTTQIVEDIFTMLPFLPNTIRQNLSILSRALQISGVSQLIDFPTKGPYTLFAPTDAAISALPPALLEELMRNPARMKRFLLNHMLPNSLFIKEDRVPVNGFLQTVGGLHIPFRKTADGQITVGVNRARIIFANRPGNNGVNHVIDKVIMFNESSSNLGAINRRPWTTRL